MPVYDESELMHYGILRRSGRYPWGSGKDSRYPLVNTQYQRSQNFMNWYEGLKSQGLSHKDIAASLGLKDKWGRDEFTSTQLRYTIGKSNEIIKTRNITTAKALAAKGMGASAIGQRMGRSEGTIRGWLKASEETRAGSIKAVADNLKAELETKGYLDVGKGTELHMGISETKLKTALLSLKDEGYPVWSYKVKQLGTDLPTNVKMLVNKGVTKSEAYLHGIKEARMQTVGTQSDDGGLTFKRPEKDGPVSVNLKRIEVNWAETGGATKDGVIELRRGVEDLSIGESRYAQVRIAVNGTHYLKGMAMYADDLPAGVDIRFNSNKSSASQDGNKLSAMKPMKERDGAIDPANPFGATVFQRVYVGKDGKNHTSALNIVNEEGDWSKWSKSLSSQMLSKQSFTLAKTQLNKAYDEQKGELDKIKALTNPVVKQKLLNEFADSADAAAVHLKAAKIGNQSTSVILPINSLKPNEIYAPNFDNGEKVALVRHPHGGPFEIPQLTVNNNNREAKRILGAAARDGVAIHHSVAAKLSGADFDGDTVLVIPNSDRKVKFEDALPGLKGFDAKERYSIPKDDTTTPRMSKRQTQTEMGKISNLITDMTLRGANSDEKAAAVRHSMVVIDAEKHGLNYKASEADNNIKSLKIKFQGSANGGASTIISRASKDIKVPEFKDRGVDPATGKKIRFVTGEMKPEVRKNKLTGEYEPTGQMIEKKTKVKSAAFTDDARTLLSPDATPMERLYADHSNSMKSLANEARRTSVSIHPPKKSNAAESHYATEVKALNAKLKLAEMNAPIERRAQIVGNAMAKARIDATPEMDKDEIKRIRYQSLTDAREKTGAGKQRIGAIDKDTGKSTLTDREWEAIQANAISPTKLRSILANADMDRVTELARPRQSTALSDGQLARAHALMATGRHSMSDIAALLGVPRSTLSDNLK